MTPLQCLIHLTVHRYLARLCATSPRTHHSTVDAHGALYAICVETTVHPAAPTLPRPPQSSTAACVRPPCPSSRVVPPLLHLLKHRRRHTLRPCGRGRGARVASVLELEVLALQKWRRCVICKQPVAHHHAPPHLHHSGDRERRLSPALEQLTFGVAATPQCMGDRRLDSPNPEALE